jgi:type VII secretion-associated serine protease mycosin
MPLGGGWSTRRAGRFALTVATLVATVSALSLAHGAAASSPASPVPARSEFRLVRTADGHLTIERGGPHAATASLAGATALAAPATGWEQDAVVSAAVDPNESEQWGLSAADFEAAWSLSTGSRIVVAVVDSGVRCTHQDLAGAVLPGVDFVAPGGNGCDDQNGHGTHVAGIIGALRNGVGGVGGAPSVRILPVRVLDANGNGFTSDVAQGIIWAADHGARVINLSLGGPTPSAAMQQAMQYANSRGAVVVVAAGNYGTSGNPVMYPAAYPEALSVGAVDQNLSHAPFSETGNYIDLSAPGVGILSTWNSNDSSYAWATGTSMATPFVSAAAALVLSQRPALSASQVAADLEASARDLGAPGWDPVYGHGLVNPSAALVHPNVPAASEGSGYWVVGANGRVSPFGAAKWYGDLAHSMLFSPTVASAATPSGNGYWLATADGHVVAFGGAHSYGDASHVHLDGGIVAMAATPTGRGYWLMGSDGGVFSFGDARFWGSTGGMRLTAPALDLAPTATGRGYWFVAADGGVFCFGDASFRGSTGGMQLWQPVRSMTAAPRGQGYWLVARDGGIFTFGVPFHGSLAMQTTGGNGGVRIRAVPSGAGYVVLTADGGVHAFGTARFFGSAFGRLGAPAVDLMLLH